MDHIENEIYGTKGSSTETHNFSDTLQPMVEIPKTHFTIFMLH